MNKFIDKPRGLCLNCLLLVRLIVRACRQLCAVFAIRINNICFWFLFFSLFSARCRFILYWQLNSKKKKRPIRITSGEMCIVQFLVCVRARAHICFMSTTFNDSNISKSSVFETTKDTKINKDTLILCVLYKKKTHDQPFSLTTKWQVFCASASFHQFILLLFYHIFQHWIDSVWFWRQINEHFYI